MSLNGGRLQHLVEGSSCPALGWKLSFGQPPSFVPFNNSVNCAVQVQAAPR